MAEDLFTRSKYCGDLLSPARNQQPDDLVERLAPLVKAQARSVVESTLGDVGQARAFAHRLAALVDELEDVIPDAIPQPSTTPDGTVRWPAALGSAPMADRATRPLPSSSGWTSEMRNSSKAARGNSGGR